MRRHILAYTFLLLVLASADALDIPAQEFYGYLTFEDQNIGLSASGSTTPGKEDLGCVDPNKLFPRNTSDFYFQLARTICDRNENCQYFNNEEVKHWVQDNTTISYISNHSCGNFTNGTVVPTTTCALKHYKNGYLHCKGIDAVYVPLATFALPPFLIAKSCNQNPLCVAFTVDKKGSTGTLFSAGSSPESDYYLKLPRPSSVAKMHSPSPEDGKTMFGGYHVIEEWSLTTIVASTPILMPCNTYAVPDMTLMDVDELKAACSHAPANCSTFTTSTPPAPQGGTQVDLMVHQQNVNQTTYISNSVCKLDVGSCYDNFPKSYLSCPDLNTATPAILMETYDLPAKILAEACALKGCHFFVAKNDNSGGSLYKFASGVVSNVSKTNSYIRIPV